MNLPDSQIIFTFVLINSMFSNHDALRFKYFSQILVCFLHLCRTDRDCYNGGVCRAENGKIS